MPPATYQYILTGLGATIFAVDQRGYVYLNVPKIDADPPNPSTYQLNVSLWCFIHYLTLTQNIQVEAREVNTIPTRRSEPVTITIHILDVNDNSPQFEQPIYMANTTAGGAERDVVKVVATDVDSGTFGQVSYAIAQVRRNTDLWEKANWRANNSKNVLFHSQIFMNQLTKSSIIAWFPGHQRCWRQVPLRTSHQHAVGHRRSDPWREISSRHWSHWWRRQKLSSHCDCPGHRPLPAYIQLLGSTARNGDFPAEPNGYGNDSRNDGYECRIRRDNPDVRDGSEWEHSCEYGSRVVGRRWFESADLFQYCRRKWGGQIRNRWYVSFYIF